MKKIILSPLCSAFVIPGLGQIINRHLKKGVCILVAVFIIFLAGMLISYQTTNAVIKESQMLSFDSVELADKLMSENLSNLWYLLAALSILWIYSVLDAFWAGRKIDQLIKEKNNESLFDR